MKILERGSIIVALIGLSMKILSRTGGNELLMIGTTVLAIVYFFLGFALLNNIQLRAIFEKSSYASVSGGRIMGAIGVGFFLSIVVVGMLFKLLILTGALEDLTIGITGLVATLFAAGIIFIIKKKKMDSFYKNIFLKGAIALLIGTSIYLTPTRSLIGFFYRNNPAFGELLLKAVENPYDKDIQKEYEEALERKNGNK